MAKCLISTIWHSGKGIATQAGTDKCCRGWGEGWIGEDRTFKAVKIFYIRCLQPLSYQTHTGSWPVRNWQHSGKRVAGRASKVSSVFSSPLPITHTTWALENKLQDPTDYALWWAVKLFHYTSQYNNNENKVYSKCDELESLQNHSPTSRSTEKLSSMKSVLGAKKLGHHLLLYELIMVDTCRYTFVQMHKMYSTRKL